MLVSFFIFNFLIINLLGFSYLYKIFYEKIVTKKKNTIYIQNNDIIYGIFFLILILLIAHFLFPIKILVIPIFFIGTISFIYLVLKKKIKLDFLKLNLIFIFFLIFINSTNGPTYDTQLYHHQILNWNFYDKISLNLTLIEDRYGMISPWQLLLSIGNFKIFDSYVSCLFNFLPIIVIINYFLIEKDKVNVSSIFLKLSILFIFLYSLIHPFNNGIIFMHLGSLGTDLASMIFFILSVYSFLKDFEDKDSDYYNQVLIFSTITIFCRISYLPIILLPLFILVKKKNFIKYFRINLLISFLYILWFVRSILNNGCLIYPFKYSCLNLDNFISLERVEQYSNIVKSFARTAPKYINFMNLDYSIYSFKWFAPWLKEYFLKSSLTQISLTLSLLFVIPFFIKILRNKNSQNVIFVLIVFFLNFMLWLQAPDIRFAFGLLISIPVLFISVAIPKNFSLINNSILKTSFILILIALFFKNINHYEEITKKNIFIRNYDVEGFKIINNFDNYKIVINDKNQRFCYDTKYICVLNDEINFKIRKNYFGYKKFIEID